MNADKNEMSECIAGCGDARRVTFFCLAVFRLMRAFRTIHIQKALMNPFMSILGEKVGGVPPKKINNFERFFSDSTLTFLTSENTFLLPILPTRRVVLLRSAPK